MSLIKIDGLNYNIGAAEYKSLLALNTDSAVADMLIIDVNPSSGALTAGGIRRMPGLYEEPLINTGAPGNIIITGAAVHGDNIIVTLFDAEISGLNFSRLTEIRPFREAVFASGGFNVGRPANRQYGITISNSANPGEFLFIQHGNAGHGSWDAWSTARFSFGLLGDSTEATNIAGIALETVTGGRQVRVQVSGKLLPGLWSGLRPGALYILGINGGLAEYTGAGVPVGMAASARDFIFYGANNLR